MSNMAFIVTCEHASKAIPPGLMRSIHDKSIVQTHEGYDIGALSYAKIVANRLSAPLFIGSYSRLLVDLNRSLSNRHLFSRYTQHCSVEEKRDLIQKYYQPFRLKVYAAVEQKVQQGFIVVHLSCHSFTSQLGAHRRTMDLGILYDPSRTKEVEFSARLVQRLKASTSMCIRKNAPYRGDTDGHVAYLRRQFPCSRYLGIELEVNQTLCAQSSQCSIWRYVWLPALCREMLSLCHDHQ